jgi:hypothetical protein
MHFYKVAIKKPFDIEKTQNYLLVVCSELSGGFGCVISDLIL